MEALHPLAALALLTALGAQAQTCPVPEGVDVNRVLAVVRSTAFVEAANKMMRPGVLPSRALTGDLAVVFAENTPKQLKYFRVPEAEAPCWQQRAVLVQHARNLISEVGAMRLREDKSGVTMVLAGGNFEASLILSYRTLRRGLDKPLDAILVGVPNRDMLLMADPNNPEAVRALQAVVERSFAEGTHPLSNKLYLLGDCMLQVVDPAQQQQATSTCS